MGGRQQPGPVPGQDWNVPQAPYGQGGYHADGWQAAPGAWRGAPEQGQDWIEGPGGEYRNPDAGPGQQPGAGWVPGQDQFGGVPYTGAPQSVNAAPGQGWPGPGQPYQGQPYPGQLHPGQRYAGPGYPGVRETGAFSQAGSPLIRQRNSALPEPPPNAKGPIAAIETDNVAAFARDLRVLRGQAGLDYPDMAEKSHYTMRTLASAAGGLRLPTLPVLIAYVNACGGDVGAWEERWGRLSKAAKRGAAALPASTGQQPSVPGQPGLPAQRDQEQPPVPHNPGQTGEIYVITSAKQRDERW